MEDKRRYKSRSNNRSPMSPHGNGKMDTGNIARDGYVVRSREPLNPRRSPEVWAEKSFAAASLKDEGEASYDSYMKD
jgi:hypothetical protein